MGCEGLKTMRVMVTGGFGFLGARLARHLADAGYRIRLGSRRHLPPPSWLPQAETVQMNWDDAETLVKACEDCEVVIHAAGMNAPDCAADPVGALLFNGVATARLVQAAAHAGVSHIVYLSTAHVYASPLAGRLDEYVCPRNLHPYASSHLAGETAMLHAVAQSKQRATVLRLSNVCGVPVTADANCWMLLFNDLCREAVTHRRLTLRSDPRQQRDFITMADAVRAIDWLVSLPGDTGQGVFNVGAGHSKTLFEMAQAIRTGCMRSLGYVPEILMPATAGSAPPALDFRVDRLLSTGFVPENNFNTEVDATLSFCRGKEVGTP
jgi:UDP-glucose 4-epimerase